MKSETTFSIQERSETDKGYSIIMKHYLDSPYSIFGRGMNNRVCNIKYIDNEFNKLYAMHDDRALLETDGAIFLSSCIMARESITEFAERHRDRIKPSLSNRQYIDETYWRD